MAFETLIGQERVKKKLNFYLDVHKRTKVAPFLNFIGARGLGKTAYAREFAHNLTGSRGQIKKFYEINSSTIKSLPRFLDEMFLPYWHNKEVTILLDEAHAMPDDLVNALLTVLNTEDSPIREFNSGDMVYRFDFSKQTLLFSTTDPQLLFDPLKDRLKTVEISDYTPEELKKIFQLKLPNHTFTDEALDAVASVTRSNARSCVLLAEDLRNYCEAYGVRHIDKTIILELFNILGVLPHGLNNIEWNLLKVLSQEGKSTLTSLAAKTGLSRNAIQKEYEIFLLRKGFITIEGLRKITRKGYEILEKGCNW